MRYTTNMRSSLSLVRQFEEADWPPNIETYANLMMGYFIIKNDAAA